jgi:hypothetical protein
MVEASCFARALPQLKTVNVNGLLGRFHGRVASLAFLYGLLNVRANDVTTVFRHMRITELVAMRLAPVRWRTRPSRQVASSLPPRRTRTDRSRNAGGASDQAQISREGTR